MEKADWKKRGVTFVGGSRDGSVAQFFPASPSMNLSNTIADEEIVETYRRTDRAIDGNTVFEWEGDRPDLLD